MRLALRMQSERFAHPESARARRAYTTQPDRIGTLPATEVGQPVNAIDGELLRTQSNQQTDAALVALLQRMIASDETALADFYDRTLGHIYGLALRITGHANAAEEVVGDVYLQAWRDARRYQPERARVLGWLMMICRSRALDHLRRRDRAELHAEPHALSDPSDEANPANLLEISCTQGRVRAALAELNDIQRQLIALAFFRGLTHQEIAEQTLLPVGTVKSHIRRGMQTMQVVLTAGVS